MVVPGLNHSLHNPKIHMWGGPRFISLLVHIPEYYIYTLRLSVLYSVYRNKKNGMMSLVD